MIARDDAALFPSLEEVRQVRQRFDAGFPEAEELKAAWSKAARRGTARRKSDRTEA